MINLDRIFMILLDLIDLCEKALKKFKLNLKI